MDEDEFRKQFMKKSVFKQANTLDQAFVPEKLYCRDEVLKSLIFNYRRILEEEAQPSINCLLMGKGGVGKTATARYFGKNFKTIALEKDVNLFLEYFNCITFRSKSKIIREMLAKYTHGSGRGFSDDEALKLILTQLIREQGYMLLIIDEVHILKSDEILAFLDIAETFGHQNAKLSILLISRTKDWMRIENEKILSRLNQKISLKPYNYEDSLKILDYRSELAFKENVLNPNLIEMIAEIVSDHRNMRHGIEILRKSGLYADKEGLDRITADIIREASNEVYSTFRADIIDQLNDQELLALYGVAQSLRNTDDPFTLVDDAYEEYQTICETYSIEPHVKMSFRKYVRNLNQLKIIRSKTVRIEEAERGRHLEITLLDIPPAKLEELLIEIFDKKFS
ncbi:MAG: Cdc6/Cdc18 family protein [Candidatus Hermodarchaeota archaeon]